MAAPDYPRDIADEFRDLRRQIADLQVAARRTAAKSAALRLAVPAEFAPSDTALWVAVTTTGTMTEAWRASLYKQHTFIEVVVRINSDGASDTLVDLFDADNNVVLATFVTSGSTITHMVATTPGSVGDFVNLTVRATRSGVGLVQVQVLSAIGRE